MQALTRAVLLHPMQVLLLLLLLLHGLQVLLAAQLAVHHHPRVGAALHGPRHVGGTHLFCRQNHVNFSNIYYLSVINCNKCYYQIQIHTF